MENALNIFCFKDVLTVSFQSFFFLFGFFGNIIVILTIGMEKGWQQKSSSCFALNLDKVSTIPQSSTFWLCSTKFEPYGPYYGLHRLYQSLYKKLLINWDLTKALADLLMISFAPLQIIISARQINDHMLPRNQWPFGKIMCHLWHVIIYINMFVQIIFLTLMAIDRYLAVVRPRRLNKLASYRNSRPVIGKT